MDTKNKILNIREITDEQAFVNRKKAAPGDIRELKRIKKCLKNINGSSLKSEHISLLWEVYANIEGMISWAERYTRAYAVRIKLPVRLTKQMEAINVSKTLRAAREI
jgi:hypothetical protein